MENGSIAEIVDEALVFRVIRRSGVIDQKFQRKAVMCLAVKL